MSHLLTAAAVYHILWGGVAAAFPGQVLEWVGIPAAGYTELWRYVGILTAVSGFGYGIAATAPYRRWPIVLVGLLGQLLGPLAFVPAIWQNRLPGRFGWIITASDVIWWVPFGLILAGAYQTHLHHRRLAVREVLPLSLRAKTDQGLSLNDMSHSWPTLLIFLRHTGCMFCRETLGDIAAQRSRIEAAGTRMVLVHMSREQTVTRLVHRYGLHDLPRIRDHERVLYRAFGLALGGPLDLFGPAVWWRAWEAAMLEGHWVGLLDGEVFQLAGVFLLYHGQVLRSYRHQRASDRPDYITLAGAEPAVPVSPRH